jgi:DNA end-binding protein Ku
MARAVWSGSIAFGLVSVPVKVFPATESHRVGFRELEAGTGERIRYKRVAEGSGREVAWEKIQRGFAVGKDRFVVLTEDELAAAEPERTHAIDVEQFVPIDEIDPVCWDRAYYLAPDGAGAARPYVLLRDALRKAGRVAIGRFVMRTKEYVVCIRPFEHALALHTMFFADEVRDVKAVVELPRLPAAKPSELSLAGKLIESLAGPWDARAHEDTFRRSVLALVKKKERGETIEPGAAGERPGRVVDLMEALKASLARRPPTRAPRARARAPRRRTSRR